MMNKKFLSLSLLLIAALWVVSFTLKKDFSIVGKWEGTEKGKKVTIIFHEDGQFEMQKAGEKPMKSDKKADLSYKYWLEEGSEYGFLDLIIISKDPEFPIEMTMDNLVKIINNEEIILGSGKMGQEERIKDWSEVKDTSHLKRVKK